MINVPLRNLGSEDNELAVEAIDKSVLNESQSKEEKN